MADYFPPGDKRRDKNLKDFHGKTPKEIKEARWYHGTNQDFSQFRQGRAGAIYVSPNPEFASFFASEENREGGQPNMLAVHVRAEKPFDYENKKHIRALFERLGPRLINDPYLMSRMDDVREGHWHAIEDPQVQKAIRAMGHDSFYVRERGDDDEPVKNLAVYNPAQIKSATGNRGTFDAGSPDITKAEGGGITAYHGSPYDFERFDLSKIGTGEGAQSFGHGLYFAEAEPTAISYRDRLAKEGQTSGDTIADEFAIHPDWQKTMSQEDIAEHLEDVKRKAEKIFFEGGKQKYLFSDNSILTDEGDHFRAGQKEKGHMYEVNINAHPDHFLDWDKPLRDQKQFLATVLEKFGGEQSVRDAYAKWDKLNNDLVVDGQVIDRAADNPLWQEYDRLSSLGTDRAKIRLGRILQALDTEQFYPDKYTSKSTLTQKGEDLWHAVSQMHKNNDVASNVFRESGIPGIKYLDQASRGAGEGSRNYVVFDDKLVTTKRKYARGGVVTE